MLLLDDDPADCTLGARLADVAEVMAVLAHPDGRAQVLVASPTLEPFNQPLGDFGNSLLNIVGHLDDLLAKQTKEDTLADALSRLGVVIAIAHSLDIKFRCRSRKGFKDDCRISHSPIIIQNIFILQ